MQVFNGVWRWLRDQVASAHRHNRRRLVIGVRPHSTIAAQVEALESRELLSVTYHGGALIANVANQNIFLGSDWSTNHTLNVQAGKLEQFTSSIVNNRFMDGLTAAGYNVFRGTSTPGYFDKITLDKSFDPNTQTGGISDTQIQGFIQGLINSHQVQQPNANTLYTVYVEPGVLISRGGGATSDNSFLGYHWGFAGKTASGTPLNIHYAVIAYPTFPTAPGFSITSLNNLTVVTSHEVAEAVTDPDIWIFANTGNFSALGWNDDNFGGQGEVGDLEAGNLNMFQGNEIQAIATQADTPISFNGVPGLLAPANLKLTSLPTTGTATLSWSGVVLGEGYRVYAVNGATKTLVGTTGAGTTSIKLTGLTAGTSKSFIVEAFDGTSVTDSASFTGIIPHAAAPVKGAASPSNATPVAPSPPADHVNLLQFFDGAEDRRRRG